MAGELNFHVQPGFEENTILIRVQVFASRKDTPAILERLKNHLNSGFRDLKPLCEEFEKDAIILNELGCLLSRPHPQMVGYVNGAHWSIHDGHTIHIYLSTEA